MTERLLWALLFIAFAIMIMPPSHTHAANGFEEKFFMSRACPEGAWELDTIDQDESSVTMRCEESR